MKIIISLLLSVLTCFCAQAKSKLVDINWQLYSNQDKISIYTPKDYSHDSGIVPIKFKTIINQNISKVVTVLADNKRKVQWLPKLKSSQTIEDKSDTVAIVYYVYESPWPFSDRSFLLESSAKFNKEKKELWVEMKSIKSHKSVPIQDDTVRGFSHDGYARVKYISENKTEIEMAFLNEFGGLIPGFLINIVQKKWPYIFMKNLSKQLKKKEIIINNKFLI